MLCSGPAAVAQGPGTPPTAEHLWESYPLAPEATAEPEPSAEREATTAPAAIEATRTPAPRPARARATDDSGNGSGLLVAIGAAIVAAIGATLSLFWVRRRRRGEPPAPPAPTEGEPAPAPATPAAPEPPQEVPLLASAEVEPVSPANGRVRALSAVQPPAESPLPPDRTIEWRAEIRWRAVGSKASFDVLAHNEAGAEATIGESPALEWPPSNAVAVQALTDAVERIEVSLRRAGWEQLEPGAAWYEKRFAWRLADRPEPAPRLEPEDRLEPAPRPEPADGPEPLRRFARSGAWPEGSESRFRCAIVWEAGYVTSRFKAVVDAPGGPRGRTVATSVAFKWTLMGQPDVHGERYRAELRRLAETLEAAGWTRAGRGKHWYSGRYVWGSEGSPPEHLELVPSRDGAAS